MRRLLPWRGLREHLLLTLRLNFRSRAPLIYGYVVPVLFLVAFASVFRAASPPLLREMGQLLTITILGGTCFGLPTAMVAERDRGVWRRYRLLPAPAAAIVLSTSVARALLVGSAAMLQWLLAWGFYGTPWPAHPGQLLIAGACVCFAFLGVGLVIAMLADNVPAVQAIGQCVFLPMIMIGGVGVPLRILPRWAQETALFLPGRYAVEALDACIAPGAGGLGGAKFALAALGVIGAAAFLAGFGLFRWDGGRRKLGLAAKGWIAVALSAWVLVGLAASRTSRGLEPVPGGAIDPAARAPWQQLTAADLAGIRYDGLLPDDGLVTPLARDYSSLDQAGKTRLAGIREKLAQWQPATANDPEQRVRNLLSVCAIADLAEDENEAEIARAVFDRLQDSLAAATLRQLLAWVVLHPDGGHVVTDVSGFGIAPLATETAVRERSAMYAKKFLRRLIAD